MALSTTHAQSASVPTQEVLVRQGDVAEERQGGVHGEPPHQDHELGPVDRLRSTKKGYNEEDAEIISSRGNSVPQSALRELRTSALETPHESDPKNFPAAHGQVPPLHPPPQRVLCSAFMARLACSAPPGLWEPYSAYDDKCARARAGVEGEVPASP